MVNIKCIQIFLKLKSTTINRLSVIDPLMLMMSYMGHYVDQPIWNIRLPSIVSEQILCPTHCVWPPTIMSDMDHDVDLLIGNIALPPVVSEKLCVRHIMSDKPLSPYHYAQPINCMTDLLRPTNLYVRQNWCPAYPMSDISTQSMRKLCLMQLYPIVCNEAKLMAWLCAGHQVSFYV